MAKTGKDSKDHFSSKEAVVGMVHHYETLLGVTGMMESEHPFVQEALATIAAVKKHFGNRCFLCRRTLDELFSRDLLSEEDITLEPEGDEDGEEA